METPRLVLLLSLGLVLMLIWQAWQEDYGPKTAPPAARQPQEGLPTLPQALEETVAPVSPVEAGDVAGAGNILVRTDVFELLLSRQGGSIRELKLLKYPVSLRSPMEPYMLLTDAGPLVHVIEGGLLSEQPAPNHKAIYQATQEIYVLPEGQNQLEMRLSWSDNGIDIDKIYTFYRGQYVIDVRYEIRNQGPTPWKGWAYGQLKRNMPEGGSRLIYTYTGAAISSPDKRYEKIEFEDMKERPVERRIANGWAAMIQHYFISAVIPAHAGDEYRYYSLVLSRNPVPPGGPLYVIGANTPALSLASGETGSLAHRLYIGPKLQDVLPDVAPGLELTVDYGALWVIAKPLFWCLEKLHDLTGNWGWAIILLTVFIKIAFYHLSAAGYRSMANMRRVQPRLMALRDRYANDKARLNQAMMELYREEKINPLGGCLPILIQIPVFIALYWVLLESVELRQAPFALWLNDLSSPDPYFILPIIMGATMFIQQKLNPAPMDPVQEKVMLALPFVFTVFFAFFPSGLVLYWVVNNVLSIGQQWLIAHSLEQSAKPA
jgi:YidC/Oxa1 family membrane protein insertase